MNVLIWGIAFIAAVLLLHLVIWRLCLPRNPVKLLLLLFSSVAFLGMILLAYCKLYPPAKYLHIFIFFLSVFAAYLSSYPAIEADSPSLVIVSRIHKAGKAGLSFEAISESYDDDLLVGLRLKELVGARLVDFDGKTYKINHRGVVFMLPFMLYRNFLGLGKGG